MSWQTSNATDVSIDGIGAVQASGSQQVSPTDSTTYHLTAKGAGGTQEATTRLTVTLAAGTGGGHSVAHGRRSVRPEREGHLFRLRQVRHSRRISRLPSRRMLNSSTSIPTSTSRLRDTAITAAQPNTTWPWAISVPLPSRTHWWRPASAPAASRPSATARKSRSAWKKTKPAGSRIAAATSSIRSSWRFPAQGRRNPPPLTFHVPRSEHLPNLHHPQSI